MKTRRRDFLKLAGLTGLGAAGLSNAAAAIIEHSPDLFSNHPDMTPELKNAVSLIGNYGEWAASLNSADLPSLSFRRKEWSDLAAWKEVARQRFVERLAIPDIKGLPAVTVEKSFSFDGLHIENLTWQLPYGNPTKAVLLKPLQATGRLPAILGLHDHGAVKYFGHEKITRTGEDQHPLMKVHQKEYYDGFAWANEMARRGYVVLVPDAFAFASRRVMLKDVPSHLRHGRAEAHDEDIESIQAYNNWAADHEAIMAKSLFSAGTTWPGVFFAEDRVALDILCAREDVDKNRVGCGGLSGGGLRTVYMGALEPRIKCTVCVGFMTTWKDLVVDKSFTHTWMIYVPLLPNELDFPEIMGLHAPLPTLVLNNEQDDLFTLSEMKTSDAMLQEVFRKAGAGDRYRCSFYPGPHKFDTPMQKEAFEWFDRWLVGQ